MLRRVEVPEHLQRNAPKVAARGYEHTGEHLIKLATRLVGLEDLREVDVLDVGCGVRFAQTMINRGIPIRSYTGVEVDRDIVDFLSREIEAHDSRFRFVHWRVFNKMYCPEGPSLSTCNRLPVEGAYDLIWLFSVFTHLDEEDATSMLSILRRHVRPNGKLFFSAFIDPGFEGFDDRKPATPLLNAYFGKGTMEKMVEQAGWSIDAIYDRDLASYIVDHLVCSPAKQTLRSGRSGVTSDDMKVQR